MLLRQPSEFTSLWLLAEQQIEVCCTLKRKFNSSKVVTSKRLFTEAGLHFSESSPQILFKCCSLCHSRLIWMFQPPALQDAIDLKDNIFPPSIAAPLFWHSTSTKAAFSPHPFVYLAVNVECSLQTPDETLVSARALGWNSSLSTHFSESLVLCQGQNNLP